MIDLKDIKKSDLNNRGDYWVYGIPTQIDGETQYKHVWAIQYSLTPHMFIELWQTSTSLDEFENRIKLINSTLTSKYGLIANTLRRSNVAISGDIRTYRGRAARYRKKGVEMKKLARIQKNNERTDWNELATFAASI